MLHEAHSRHVLKNFFVKKNYQVKIIIQIFTTVLIGALITTGMITYMYNLKSRDGNFYYMSNDIMQDLELKSILGIVLPSLLAVQTITILVAFGISLFSSRKIAVPLYKVEKWASRLKTGNLNTTLAFREEDGLEDLISNCNGVSHFYHSLLSEIKESVRCIEQQPQDLDNVNIQTKKMKDLLNRVQL